MKNLIIVILFIVGLWVNAAIHTSIYMMLEQMIGQIGLVWLWYQYCHKYSND